MSFFENPFGLGIVGVVLGAVAGYGIRRWREHRAHGRLRVEADGLLGQARRESDTIRREARLQASEDAIKLREETERGFQRGRKEMADAESRLAEREALLTRQMRNLSAEDEKLQRQYETCREQSKALEDQRQTLDGLMARRREELHRLAGLSETEARALLLKEVELEALKDAAQLTRRILNDAEAHAEEKARRIISLAIQRYAGEHTNEISSATVALPGEELKGRIIGREGRNIRAFENATGVTVLIDDTPNAVVLSTFDPVRRAIARESMQRLLADGRIHPTRIEDVVSKVAQEMEETIVRAGEEAVQKAGLRPMHPEIVRLLGRLRFRYSFSQNVLDHSIEVAHLTGLLAAELGLDVQTAKRAGLLHDLGKAVNHEVEGAHALVGADIIRRHGEPPEVVNAVAAHHDEAPHHGPLGMLVGAADAISASRPGARSETMTAYLKRVEALERIGGQIAGVEKCFAVQAGRELRVLVQPEKVNDEQALVIARKLSKRIEEELQYPGQIRVTVVRETRCVEFAK